MKNSEGYELKASHVPASWGDDFASVRIEKAGCMSFSVYPLTASELRELAGELLACAGKMDAAAADNQRLNSAVAEAMWEGAP